MQGTKLEVKSGLINRRRFCVFGLAILSTVLATLKWTDAIPSDLNPYTRYLVIFLFILTFAWIALFFWSSIFGFFLLRRGSKFSLKYQKAIDIQLTSKTAILMPVYNEAPAHVFANILAMAEDISSNGKGSSFDFFILSDSTNPKVWVEEERVWFETKKIIPPKCNLFYRRRPRNVARKSGNIEDFCNKWGINYDFMIVLDADSLVAADTIIKMASLMEFNTDAGIIQAPPMSINRNTLFARVQQFAGKVYGPIVSAGLTYWQGDASNYWGHNAIIRVQAFIDCCGLPVLKGRKPFGGYILSHDFVEAALIRRAGWKTWLLTDLGGSYEETPATLIDFAARDRRWCQGNMQHLKVLFARGLHPISRLHFVIGIMSYLSSLLWFSFLVVGIMIALREVFFPPTYFPDVKTLFPEWPVFDVIGTIVLFIFSMSMLIFPKFLGWLNYIRQEEVKKFASFLSVIFEIFISVLVAPIMMVFQSKFIVDIFLGKSISWSTQSRDDTGTSLEEALRRHWFHTLLGLLSTFVLLVYTDTLFWWMLPVNIGLVFSIPISVFVSKSSLGLWAKRKQLLVIPEEINPPNIVVEADRSLKKLQKESTTRLQGLDLLLHDDLLNAVHILMLPANGPAPIFDPDVFKTANLKLNAYINADEVLNLTDDEEFSLLYDVPTLIRANIALKLKG